MKSAFERQIVYGCGNEDLPASGRYRYLAGEQVAKGIGADEQPRGTECKRTVCLYLNAVCCFLLAICLYAG